MPIWFLSDLSIFLLRVSVLEILWFDLDWFSAILPTCSQDDTCIKWIRNIYNLV